MRHGAALFLSALLSGQCDHGKSSSLNGAVAATSDATNAGPAAVPPAAGGGPAPDRSRLKRLAGVATRVGESAVRDTGPPERFGKRCQIWTPCPALPPLKRCDPSLHPIAASWLDSAVPPVPSDERVALRGAIRTMRGKITAMWCDNSQVCCNRASSDTFIGDPPHGAFLPYGCGGDESRQCGAYWVLTDAELCDPAAEKSP